MLKNVETTIEPVENYVSRQPLIPAFAVPIVEKARREGTLVEVSRLYAPFGVYVLEIKNTNQKAEGVK